MGNVTRIGKYEVHTLKVEFDDENYIELSADNANQFDAFVAGYRKLCDMAEETEKQIDEIQKRYEGIESETKDLDMVCEISKVNISTSAAAVEIADGIFGEGTAKKYFAEGYEKYPDFLPNADMMLDFFVAIAPTMEDFFGKRLEERDKMRRQKMAKYQPQDHKRKQK